MLILQTFAFHFATAFIVTTMLALFAFSLVTFTDALDAASRLRRANPEASWGRRDREEATADLRRALTRAVFLAVGMSLCFAAEATLLHPLPFEENCEGETKEKDQ